MQTYVEVAGSTAQNRNLKIIYKSKSCNHILYFSVLVGLDHAAHMDFAFKSSNSASETISWSLFVMHVQGRSLVLPYTQQSLLLQLANVHPTLGYRNVLGQGSQTQQYCYVWYMSTRSINAGKRNNC